ncbi:MAG: hypothetical protein JWP89_6444 [Schlesneria sp.]|nr:hypothetical protein [Schlesneria sp.]
MVVWNLIQVPPFQGLSVRSYTFPRALPGADLWYPFGAEVGETVFGVAESSVKDTALSKTSRPWHP